MSKTYFNNRDLINVQRTEKILDEDLPNFAENIL